MNGDVKRTHQCRLQLGGGRRSQRTVCPTPAVTAEPFHGLEFSDNQCSLTSHLLSRCSDHTDTL